MSKTITYAITYANERWVSRCPTGEVEGVGVASSLSQLECDLAEIHAWAWPERPPGVGFIFDLPEDVARVVAEYSCEKELAGARTNRHCFATRSALFYAGPLAREAGRSPQTNQTVFPSGEGSTPHRSE
ncbi:hypothetical protein AB0F17_63450 [Nonomuraea sp. NPDC026600]|uniref:hypothetical protein n=1 Tax=Nonomuraea sp. NPDC026600 TaxID=3155363 RepID=UPI0033C526F2